MNQEKQLIEGAKIKMGGKEWVVPALNFRQTRELQGQIKTIGNIPEDGEPLSTEIIDAVSAVAHAAISRNYPDITVDDVDTMLSVNLIGPIVAAVFGVSTQTVEPAAS